MVEMKNDKSVVPEDKSDDEENKPNSYMEIYDNDSESLKEIKRKWNKRIDEIKRD